MQYLGGKTRLAPRIAETVNAERVRLGAPGAPLPFWDPFCGGLSVSVRLAALGPGIVSDACAPLIALYRAVRAGWDPPEHVTEAEYAAARALPDTDPRKAFVGFGCSFGGKWFGGYGRHRKGLAQFARSSVRRGVAALASSAIERIDFLSVEPRPLPLVIYADPPYAGTTTYAGVPPFDSDRFWRRVQAWERASVPVFVSEYACPTQHTILHERRQEQKIGLTGGSRTERLLRVLP